MSSYYSATPTESKHHSPCPGACTGIGWGGGGGVAANLKRTCTYTCSYRINVQTVRGTQTYMYVRTAHTETNFEFPQKWNLRFGGNLDFRVADFLRAEPSLGRIRFCGNANFWHFSGRKFGESCFCAVLPHFCYRSQFRKVLSHEVDNWEWRAPSLAVFWS